MSLPASNGSPGAKPAVPATASSSTSASLSRGTSMRVRAEQVWPEFM